MIVNENVYLSIYHRSVEMVNSHLSPPNVQKQKWTAIVFNVSTLLQTLAILFNCILEYILAVQNVA